MLYNLIASSSAGHRILEWNELAALAIEILAVAISLFIKARYESAAASLS